MTKPSRNHSYREVTEEEEREYAEFKRRYYGEKPITDRARYE